MEVEYLTFHFTIDVKIRSKLVVSIVLWIVDLESKHFAC